MMRPGFLRPGLLFAALGAGRRADTGRGAHVSHPAGPAPMQCTGCGGETCPGMPCPACGARTSRAPFTPSSQASRAEHPADLPVEAEGPVVPEREAAARATSFDRAKQAQDLLGTLDTDHLSDMLAATLPEMLDDHALIRLTMRLTVIAEGRIDTDF